MVLLIQLLNNGFKFGQPGNTQMAILEQDPPALVSTVLKFGLGFLSLTLTERDSVEAVHHIIILAQFHE